MNYFQINQNMPVFTWKCIKCYHTLQKLCPWTKHNLWEKFCDPFNVAGIYAGKLSFFISFKRIKCSTLIYVGNNSQTEI